MFHVLVAHDLTARSEIALIRGARLALEREGHLTIVHVVDGDLPAPAIDAQRRSPKSISSLRFVVGWDATSRPFAWRLLSGSLRNVLQRMVNRSLSILWWPDGIGGG